MLAERQIPALFFDFLNSPPTVPTCHRRAGFHAKFFFSPERLAGGAVPAVVRRMKQLLLIMQLRQAMLHDAHMARLGRADEVVVGNSQERPELLEALCHLIRKGLRRLARRRRGLLDFLPVLIGAGQEEHGLALQAPVAGQTIRRHLGIGMADVRRGVDVVQGRGEIKRLVHRFVAGC